MIARLTRERARLAAFVAVILGASLLASSALAACCGQVGAAKQRAMSSHECCPEQQAPELLRASCSGCGAAGSGQVALLAQADSSKHPLGGSLPASLCSQYVPVSRAAPAAIYGTNAPPVYRPNLLSSIVILR